MKQVGFKVDIVDIRQAELYVICRALKPKIVVETGVERGISSMFILEALKDNCKGTLYSIEVLKSLPNRKKVGHFVPVGLQQRWKLLIGRSLDVLPKLLPQIDSIDVFIHDSEHEYQTMFSEYSLAWPFIEQGGLLLSDDTGRNEAFIHFCEKVGRAPTWTERGYGLIQK
jgi:predicted O-methyltransferase YrrM